MPFRIIRNDITKVSADAIVNTANPEPIYAGGTDAAIYKAAGEKELLAERKKIGRIEPGEAVATKAFALPAKYIIHTSGPVWMDGNHGEYDILRSCYRKSLLLADQLGCESIAFPLIATGIYGFPKDKALEIALAVIKEHLENSDLDVTLVVFSRGAYELAAGLTEKVGEYIDENYVSLKLEEEYGMPSGSMPEDPLPKMRRLRRLWENLPAYRRKKPSSDAEFGSASSDAVFGNASSDTVFDSDSFDYMAAEPPMASSKPKKESLEDAVNNLGETFQARLLRMIDERGMTDPEVYKRANVDRKLFSKIRCSDNYIPKKRTIVALAIALKLNMDDTKDLLYSAGLSLANNSKADVIVSFCIENGIYDIFEVNALLFKFDQPILG